MARPRKDSFYALAEVMRQNPKDVLKPAGAIQALYLLPKETKPEDVAAVVRRIQRDKVPRLMAALLRGAAEQVLAPKRKGGRPRKQPDPFDALLLLRQRRELDLVAGAIEGGDEKEMKKVANSFPAKRSRPVALKAMARYRAEIDEAEDDEKMTGRLRVYAARVILEARGGAAATEAEGSALLRRVQRGGALRTSAGIVKTWGLSLGREESAEGLLAALERADASREKEVPRKR